MEVPDSHWPKLSVKGRQKIAILMCTVTAGVTLSLWLLVAFLGVKDANLPTLKEASRGVIILDRFDKYVCTVHSDRDRKPVPLSQISINMQQAVLAAEDHNFYSHRGIDPVGVVRAALVNQRAGHIVQGASTITQQLARNLFLDKDDRSFKRKFKEVFLSWEIDKRYSKDKILETYLNEIYFGSGVYGVERAAENYFNCDAAHLTVAQSAFLAGLIRSPSLYGTPQHRAEATQRARTVAAKMAEYKFISDAEARKAFQSKLAFGKGIPAIAYPDYINYVMEVMKKEVGNAIYEKDFTVSTNLDVKAQKAAATILTKGIKAAPYGIDQGALVTLSLKDSAVLAMVGGVSGKGAWNRALFPHTAGSSFKPFVYLAALKAGLIQTDSMLADSPLVVQTPEGTTWEPKNFDGQFKGWLPVRSALAFSRNIPCVRVAQETGMANVVDVAKAAGVKSQLDSYPAAALGSSAISPLDMANAYATIARGGIYMAPQVVRSYTSSDKKLASTFYVNSSQTLPLVSCVQMIDLMQDVVNFGTGTQARLPGVVVGGKTGTADRATDIWFTGFTPDTVCSVWGGNDKVKPVPGNHVTGGGIMAKIWHDYMVAFYQSHKAPKDLAFAAPTAPFMRDYQSLAQSDAEADGPLDSAASARIMASGIARYPDLMRLNLSQPQNLIVENSSSERTAMDDEMSDEDNGLVIDMVKVSPKVTYVHRY